MKRRLERGLRLGGVLLLLASCQEGAALTKSQAREQGGRGPDGEDLCAANGWYGDGECDDWCPEHDRDCDADAGMDAGPRDGGRDGGLDATTADARAEAGAEAGMDAGACVETLRDAGGELDGGAVRVLPTGFALGRCDHERWAETVLRGPGTWQSDPSGPLGFGGLDYQTWPVELDPGQTILVEMTSLDESGGGGMSLSSGPCKNPGGGGSSSIEHTASGPENHYLYLWGSYARFEVRIVGAAMDHASGDACEDVVADVSLDTPYEHGTALPGSPFFPLGGNDAFIHRGRSCAGVRHLGGDSVWRVHLRAGERLSAGANNFNSMGDDLYGFYLVRDCCNVESCVGGVHGFGLSYTATEDETLYVVLDTFAAGDLPPDYVSIRVEASSP